MSKTSHGYGFYAGLSERDDFDFGEDALGERLDGDTASGGFLREILTVDVIEGGKVIHVGKEAGGLDDFIERATCFRKDGF